MKKLGVLLLLVTLTMTSLALTAPALAEARECESHGAASEQFVTIGLTCGADGGAADAPEVGTHPVEEAGPTFVEYRWIVACYGPASEDTRTDEACYSARTCPEPAQLLYRLWGRLEGTTTWTPLGTRCSEGTPTSLEPDRPTITPGMVLNEIRRIGLPVLQARTQPEGKTLVNFDTIFFTDAEPFTATVTLLGQQVEIVAEPAEYTWHHGDGTTSTTATPGAPYPSKQVTHRYDDADTTVRPRVDVTYTARFRVNGGAWQEIGQTVTVAGPESTLLVAEAAPVLSGDYS